TVETLPGADATTERTQPDSYVLDLRLQAVSLHQTKQSRSWQKSVRVCRSCCLTWRRCCRPIRFRRFTLNVTIPKSECYAKTSPASICFHHAIIFLIAKLSCKFNIPRFTEKHSYSRRTWMWMLMAQI